MTGQAPARASHHLDPMDLQRFCQGEHDQSYRFMGAHLHTEGEVSGVLFATWAPNAARVSLVGDFNQWNRHTHPMHPHGSSGVWELFIPWLRPGALYKFDIQTRDQTNSTSKTDPYGQSFEFRPANAARITGGASHAWKDGDWMAARHRSDWLHAPLSIYEVHLGSWRRRDDGHFLSYREIAEQLIPYVKALGFTHIQLLPVSEHPLDESWGYQTTGYFAATSRFGTPNELRQLVDQCHQHGLGVLLDWVPAHFPKDEHALARFDGSALYEHADPRQGEHPQWGTLIFNYGRNEVRSFLLSSAFYWLREFHIDGLRVDAVSSMLYLDYARQPGEWIANPYGGRENLAAIHFLQTLNTRIHHELPGVLVIAEESTDWPMISRPVYLGGLGFSMKWNMGWMNDTLTYFSKDPIHRQYAHDQLTFGLCYAFSENFVLPLSHDEVVHGKRSLLEKMPGDSWQRFANLRLLLTYQYTQPGKKLLFMGNEFAQAREWDHAGTLDWHLRQYPEHQGIEQLVMALNRLYLGELSLHRHDFESGGFTWIDCHDSTQSVLCYLRRADSSTAGEGEFLLIALNFTPIPRHGYRVGVPVAGTYQEMLNSDSIFFGGSNLGNAGAVTSEAIPYMGQPHSLQLTLPPLAGIILKPAQPAP